MRVLSLGWGVQSWTLAAMAALGEIPPVDLAIHADTTWERQRTYAHARLWTPWLEQHGVRVLTVQSATTGAVEHVTTHAVYIPAFTRNAEGKKGQLRRQCTERWKIRPLRQALTLELQARGLRKTPGVVDCLLGISTDECLRMKDSDVQYVRNQWPLIDLGMSRQDCERWLVAHALPVPVKSSCVFCPYHGAAAWRDLREDPADYATACHVDALVRDKRPPFPLFVHPARVPLPQATGSLAHADETPESLCDSGHCFL